ncbi:MAG: solute:Na+ symporter, family, partial [Gaiellaceae bacterium]|nr:solute:Na+ symporter, family [Gaiellaceae bacterium]
MIVAGIIWSQFWIFLLLFGAVSYIGFIAPRWRAARSLEHLDEWGLGGRRFGTVVTWFLLGGDLYTAYTFVAVPALVFNKGAIGLFAIPYTIVVYPLVYLLMPRLWQVASNRGYVTASDYVNERFDSRFLALLIAITGLVATMPYIALQMYGIEVVLGQMGLPVEAALIVAFVVLAVFTYISGLRAPALIAIVKDALIWIVVIVAIIYIPWHLGGFHHVFSQVPTDKQTLAPGANAAYASLALGSALALFLYPHVMTGVFASQSQQTVKRNAALLPAYSFLLGLIALLGYMAIAASIKPSKDFGTNSAVPALFASVFPDWFAGFAFAAIAIGALVPASIMSIAAANLFSRNIWRGYMRPQAQPAEEARVARIASLVVKVGALIFILALPATDVINFQLAGGVWMLQTLPAVFLALYVPWLNRNAVIAGWAVGIAWGTVMLAQESFKASTHTVLGWNVYIALAA